MTVFRIGLVALDGPGKDFDSKFDTPHRVRNHHKNTHRTTFSTSETSRRQSIPNLDLNPVYFKNTKGEHIDKKDADEPSFDTNDEILSLKKIKLHKGIHDKPRGACSGQRLSKAAQ